MSELSKIAQHSNLRLKPMILLADSQLLFYTEGNQPYMRRLLQLFEPNQPLKAAYIGASNDDQIEFFQLFESAMNNIGVNDCMHISQALNSSELSFLASAHIILLAGGEIWHGWKTIERLAPLLNAAKSNGAVIIGTSAGAVQMGLLGWRDSEFVNNTDLFSTLGYVPAMFSPHDENNEWRTLKQMVVQTAGCLPGIGIPTGSGVIVTPDNHIQAIRNPAVSFTIKGDKIIQQPAWKIQLN